jgi:hypothetical protein
MLSERSLSRNLCVIVLSSPTSGKRTHLHQLRWQGQADYWQADERGGAVENHQKVLGPLRDDSCQATRPELDFVHFQLTNKRPKTTAQE